ncbi:MAG: DISARM system SNF2-like helicase DrmD, partial [Anaerolineae bacterium]|nr:DISARM system SNF2-like helicase DrmD [Anaerolineae bacterium]
QIIKPNGQWSDKRVIIFSEYRATQNWLQTMLAAEGFTTSGRLQTLYGGMDPEKREQIKAAFQADPKDSLVRILLATDAASEGIDLQRHCHRLIHIEIPWNPNRLEQRNGRIDRHGQQHSPLVYHFVGKDYQNRQHNPDMAPSELEADLEFLMIAALKIDQIREDLGKVGPVIADQVEAAMLGGRRQLYTDEAERSAEPIRKQLKFERDLRAQIEKLHDQLQESRYALHLSPDNVQAVVEIALQLAGQPPLRPTEIEGIWPDPTGRRQTCPVFNLPTLNGTWARCVEGLAHPHTGEVRPIVFDNDLIRNRDDLVLVHLNHILVQMSLRLLRAEIWSREGNKRLHRVAARLVPNRVLDTPAVIAHARLVVIGGDSQRLHEEIITVGGEIREGRFRRMNVGQVSEALAAALPGEPSDEVKQRFVDLWPQMRPSLVQSLEARRKDRITGLEKFLAERADKEVMDITAILRELARTIEAELTEPEYQQLELFDRPERDQYDRNLIALRHRLAQIPAEIDQESALIRARFADPEARLFPVAVTFLVPGRLSC